MSGADADMAVDAPPPMAVTMGDANGVGPEILLRRFAAGALDGNFVVYGDAAILRAGAARLGLDVAIRPVDAPGAASPDSLQVVDAGMLGAADLTPGQSDRRVGEAARRYVEAATRAALRGAVAGVVTLPLNKTATRASTPGFVGHTEFIAGICGVDDFAIMLMTPELSVSHVSAHVPLAAAVGLVTRARVYTVIELTHRTLRARQAAPRIAVCGLNPHAGEQGMFGTEDQRIVAPAIADARRAGIDADGPHPADTVFHQAIKRDRFDAIVCMYHDQGHAPMKLHCFETAVNVTIGLPIVRTSVDHGTAFDIAWRGEAFTESLGAALDCARGLAAPGR